MLIFVLMMLKAPKFSNPLYFFCNHTAMKLTTFGGHLDIFNRGVFAPVLVI